MKNIQAQYQDLLEGKMSSANFMVNVRRDFPQWVSSTNSFKDAVNILKSKKILSESVPGVTEVSDNTVEQDLKNMIARGNSYEEAIEYIAAELDMDPAELAAEYPRDMVDIEGHDGFGEPGDDEEDPGFDDWRMGMRGLNEAAKKSEGAWKNVTGKAEYDAFPGADHVNYNQLMKGLQYELSKMGEITDEALVKAKQKAVKNLTKDPNAYRDLVITNVKDVEKKDKSLRMQPVKKDNIVDKANAMKVVEKDAKGNVQDSLGKKERAKNKNGEGVKQMTQTPKKAKGIAQTMEVPGKEKVLALKEHLMNEFSFMQRESSPEFAVGSRVETKDGKHTGVITAFDKHTATVKLDGSGIEKDMQPNILKHSTAAPKTAEAAAPRVAEMSNEDKLKALKEKLIKAMKESFATSTQDPNAKPIVVPDNATATTAATKAGYRILPGTKGVK